jgi:hypothetical protein
MREGDRQARDVRIIALFQEGIAPANIAERVGIGAKRVRTILTARGYRVERAGPAEVLGSIWTQSADRRRRAFWARARKAAGEARRAP